MRYTATPYELLDHFRNDDESGTPASTIKNIATKKARNLRQDHPDTTEYLYGPDVIKTTLKEQNAPLETLGMRNLDDATRETIKMIKYWMERYRDAFAQALRDENLTVHQGQQESIFSTGACDPLEYHGYIPLKHSGRGYKISKSVDENVPSKKNAPKNRKRMTIDPFPRDFREIHPNLMPEYVDRLERSIHPTMVTFAPYFTQIAPLNGFLDDMPFRNRVICLLDVLLAAHEMHKRGFAHLDVKADNVYLARYDENHQNMYLGDLEGSLPFSAPRDKFLTTNIFFPISYYDGNVMLLSSMDAFSAVFMCLEMLLGYQKQMSLLRCMGARWRKGAGSIPNRYPREKIHTNLARFFKRLEKEQDALPENAENKITPKLLELFHQILRWEDSITANKEIFSELWTGIAITFKVQLLEYPDGVMTVDHDFEPMPQTK